MDKQAPNGWFIIKRCCLSKIIYCLIFIDRFRNDRLIVEYSTNIARKDKHNRQRGLERLEKDLASNTLTKKHISNRGYNKYLKLTGKLNVEIDYQRFEEDEKWDGLKGYVTNCRLSKEKVIDNYKNLWQIERAFRISKTDLLIRPIYHRIEDRIEAHICIAFMAYSIIKELEMRLKENGIKISAKRAVELTETIYALDFTLPESKRKENIMVTLTDEQKLLLSIVNL